MKRRRGSDSQLWSGVGGIGRGGVPTSAASVILVIMALTTSSASLMKVPPSRCLLFLLFMAFLLASMMSKSDMKLVLHIHIHTSQCCDL